MKTIKTNLKHPAKNQIYKKKKKKISQQAKEKKRCKSKKHKDGVAGGQKLEFEDGLMEALRLVVNRLQTGQ